jgi:prepilin-type N-terminal cleavage/methylation domain-containing protein
MRAPAFRQPGFTLIEMAVALFVIVLVLGSMLVPLTTQVEERQVGDTDKTLAEIREALLGFAVANGYLPCPDRATAVTAGTASGTNVANDGLEDINTLGECSAANEGNVPWNTLGVGAADVWGNRFRYQVNSNFSRRTPGATFTLTSTSNIIVCSASACGVSARYTSDAVAIIISLGKNGLGAINANTGTANPAPTSADEIQNQTGPSQFLSRTRTTVETAAGEFDDVVAWLPRSVLFNRMVAAGKLP